LQERIDVVETRFARHLRVVEVQCILNGAMTNDEISVGRKSPVLAAALPLLVSFICPLTASFSYLLVTHGVADQASQHDADQARQRRQPCTSSHNEIVDGLGRPEQSAEQDLPLGPQFPGPQSTQPTTLPLDSRNFDSSINSENRGCSAG
jgi:hypothetical protein